MQGCTGRREGRYGMRPWSDAERVARGALRREGIGETGLRPIRQDCSRDDGCPAWPGTPREDRDADVYARRCSALRQGQGWTCSIEPRAHRRQARAVLRLRGLDKLADETW